MTVATNQVGSSAGLGSSRAAIVLAAFWAVAVLPATILPMTDPDTFWHIRAGIEILETGRIPTTDAWSIVGQGRSWVTQDWLSNVGMAAAYQLGEVGPTLLSLLYGLVATAAIAICWTTIGLRPASAGWLGRTVWLLFGLVLAAPVLGVRVQVVDLLLAAAVLHVLWRYLARRRPIQLLWLPAVALVWVNLHAGFPLLFLLGGAVLVGELVDRLAGRRPVGEPLTWSQSAYLLGALALAAAALVVNPNGPAIYTYPFDTLRIGALAESVGEWQSASLDAPAGQLLTAFVLVGVVPTVLLGWSRMRTADGLVLIGLTAMAWIAVRFLLVAGPLGAVVVAAILVPVLSASAPGRRVSELTARFGRPDSGMRGLLNGTLALALLLAGLTLAGARIIPGAQAAAVSRDYPVSAVRWLASRDRPALVFNRYEWGGYLGLHRPDRPVFIDGRADVYGDQLLREYVAVISVTTDPQEVFDRYAIDGILYPPDSTLGRWLDGQTTWRRAFEDDVGVVWIRD